MGERAASGSTVVPRSNALERLSTSDVMGVNRKVLHQMHFGAILLEVGSSRTWSACPHRSRSVLVQVPSLEGVIFGSGRRRGSQPPENQAAVCKATCDCKAVLVAYMGGQPPEDEPRFRATSLIKSISFPLGPIRATTGRRHSPTAGSWGGGVSYERGNPVSPMPRGTAASTCRN